MVRTFIQVLAVCWVLVASVFLIRANLGLSAENIAQVSSTMWGHNAEVARSLAKQSADTKVGLVILLLAFLLQMWHLLWPMRWDDFDVNRAGAVLAVLFALASFIIGRFVSNMTAQRTMAKVTLVLDRSGAK